MSKDDIKLIKGMLLRGVSELEAEAYGGEEDRDKLSEPAKGQIYAYENVRKLIFEVMGEF